MITVQLETFIEQLKSAVKNKDIVIKALKMEGGSYGIEYGTHRIARIVYVPSKGQYKCTCDSEKSKRIFDSLSAKYIRSPDDGIHDQEKKKAKVLHLSRSEDMMSCLLEAIQEYTR